MLDLLSQESDKDPGLLFLHNLKKKKKKKKKGHQQSKISLLTAWLHLADIHGGFSSESPFQTWSQLFGIYAFTGDRHPLSPPSLGVNMGWEGVRVNITYMTAPGTEW